MVERRGQQRQLFAGKRQPQHENGKDCGISFQRIRSWVLRVFNFCYFSRRLLFNALFFLHATANGFVSQPAKNLVFAVKSFIGSKSLAIACIPLRLRAFACPQKNTSFSHKKK
jgi:nucleoside recognition membrane protein YjiH